MSNFYHNIFYYYRGAQESDKNRERQLEDNTTKALINTLEYGGRKVRNGFLEWIGVEKPENIRFELQKKTIGKGRIERKSKRVLLALVPAEGKATPLVESGKQESRPDAWIYGDDFAVLIESKVVGYLDADQMRYHFQKLTIGEKRFPVCEERTWAELHAFFKSLTPELTENSRWIVNQFMRYLEYCNMTDFTGFEKEIFDFFFIHDSEESKKWVKETIKSFAEETSQSLKAVEPFYEDYDVGSLSLKKMQTKEEENHAWAAFGPKDSKYRNYAHQTIILNSQGIEVLVNVELKSAVDRLKEKVLRDKQTFVEIIRNLKPEASMVVQLQERKQIQASLYSYHQVFAIEVDYLKKDELGEHGFDYLVTMLQKIPLPYFTVKAKISRSAVLSMKDQKKQLVEKVIHIMTEFHSMVRYINE